MDTNTTAVETKAVEEVKAETKKAATTKTKGGSTMDKVDYSNHKAWSQVVVAMALTKGVKVAQEYGKAILKQGKIKAPWDNPMHCMKKGIAADNKELLLKAVAILGVKKDNPTGNKHVLDELFGKVKANFAKDGLKKDEDIIRAAKKYANVK